MLLGFLLVFVTFTYGVHLLFGDGEALDLAVVIDEPNLIKHICILEESLLQTHNDELAVLEIPLDHETDVLSMM